MKAAVLTGQREMNVQEMPDPQPRPGEVLIRMKAVGVCGSDVHYYWSGGIGIHKVKYPMVLGHEGVGEVADLGEGVTRFQPGQRVAIEPGKACGKCRWCRDGKYNLCVDMAFMGTPPVNGCFCEYVAWPEEFVFPLPDNVSYEEASLLEPIAVGVYATDMAGVRVGDSIAILGCATIGLITLLCAKRAGAGLCLASDRIRERLDVAKRLGADAAVDFQEQDFIGIVREYTQGEGADIVFEAAGHPTAFFQTVQLVRKSGTIILIGICPQDVIEFDFGMARRKEVTIKSVRRYRHVFPRAISLLASGLFDIGPIITHQFDMENICEAFNLVHNCKDDVVKAVIML